VDRSIPAYRDLQRLSRIPPAEAGGLFNPSLPSSSQTFEDKAEQLQKIFLKDLALDSSVRTDNQQLPL
jgi:hypothetical protein